MTDWTIRPATAQDAGPLGRCIEAAYEIYAGRVTDLPAVSDGVDQHIENDLVFVAVGDGAVIGGLVLVPGDDAMLLANVAVDPACTGMGLGRALIELAEAQCREHGLSVLKLSTHVDMAENVALYEHLGWRETGRSGNKVYMEKHLTAA